jgi:hypothetical protein
MPCRRTSTLADAEASIRAGAHRMLGTCEIDQAYALSNGL